jgi:3'-phosphoadenosine 5'-phosphosulfate sulfotransferase (PAPS reductase)/FAD synthetase
MLKKFAFACRLHAQLPAFQRQIIRAQKFIAQTLKKCENPYIAFSTGKDSVVMAHLVWSQQPDVTAVYFDADCAFPESAQLLERYEAAGRPIVRWPCEPILDTMERMGGPTSAKCEAETMRSTVYRPIKTLLAEHHFDGAFVGLRSEESYGRRKLAQVRGQLFWQKRDELWECLPVARFSYLDVWAYILVRGVDYCAVYDRLMEMGIAPEDCRLSYWAGETKRCWGRWAILKQGWPELFNRFAVRFPEVRAYV